MSLSTILRTIVVGSSPMAYKVVWALERMECVRLVGVVNFGVEIGYLRSNYHPMGEILSKMPELYFQTKDINDSLSIHWMENRRPDLIIQAGWSQKFAKPLLTLPRLYCVGVHAAPLPEGRGAAILNWKLIEGGGPWGNSLFIMEETTDIGDIIDSEPFDIEPRDDIRTAYLKADRTALRMLERTLPSIAKGTVVRRSQKHIKTKRYFRRTLEDGALDFAWDPELILNHVRALTHPYPGAFFDTCFGRLTVWRVEVETSEKGSPVGTILEARMGRGVLVQVGDGGRIWLTEVTPPNDVETWCDIWAREKAMSAGINLLPRAI